MGVQGLWELLSPVSRPVTLESLENKILAVDVSIWLNQAIKGIRDKKGESLPNAHLLGIFHKICKLLFYKIKPVFVFDGSVPVLKKQTLLARQTQRHTAADKAKKTSHSILKNYVIRRLKSQKNAGSRQSDELHDQISKTVISSVYSTTNDMYCTPLLKENTISDDDNETHIESDTEETDVFNDYTTRNFQNPSSIDFETEAFKSLPLDVQHELLNTIKETYKRRYWAHQEEMPEEYQTFSHYQMNRLLHRRKIQKRLEEVEKDINSKNTASLDTIYKSYMNLENGSVEASRVMSEDSSHFILVKHQNKNSDNTEQAETSSASYPEKNMEEEMEQNPQTLTVPSNAAKHIAIQENLLETSINCIFSDKNRDAEHTIAEVYFQNGNNTEMKNTDDNPRQESPITSAGHIASDTLVVSHSSSQIGTSTTAQPLIVSSNISTDTAKISILHMNKLQKDGDDDGSCCNNYQAAYVAKEVTTDFAKNKNKEREFRERKNVSTCNQTITKCSNSNQHEEKAHADDPDCITKNNNENHSAVITINLTSQQQPYDDDLFPIEELERSAENINSEREEETNYSYLWDAQDSSSLIKELETLSREKQNQERRALTIAEHMYEETKELLKLFGVPYINSPTEAEAQCAKLDLLNLTNGTITDDSDIWLFGGKYVYKNFFSKNKYVEFFKNTDIQSHFNLDRSKLIALAMLTGSDYTQGVQGIGPITAMEILSEFPGEGIKHLQNFKKWWSDFQIHKELPKNAVCAKLSKFQLDDGFPSEVVYDAYLHPTVDESAEHFSWGHPDLDQLREFAQEKFGWDQKKINDMLLPVMKKLNENQLQMRIDSFFHVKLKKEEDPLSSKRLRKAIKKMDSCGTSANVNSKSTNKEQRKPRKQRKQSKRLTVSSSSLKQPNKINLSEESSSDS